MLTVTQTIGENRSHLSSAITTLTEELNTVVKDTERSRKQIKESGNKLLAKLLDADSTLDRNKVRFETLTEDLERLRIQKQIQTRDSHYNELIAKETFFCYIHKLVQEKCYGRRIECASS